MSDAPSLLCDPLEAEAFLDLVAAGANATNAAVAVGWTPARLRRLMKDQDFAQLVADSEARAVGIVEEALFRRAASGNVQAIQFFLLNRAPDRWRDVRRIEMTSETTIHVGTINATKEALLALIRDKGVQPFQELPTPTDDIIDADIIED